MVCWCAGLRKVFTCLACGKVLCSKASLKRHVADKHASRHEEYRCAICERVYCSRNSLMTHIYTYHKPKPSDHLHHHSAAATAAAAFTDIMYNPDIKPQVCLGLSNQNGSLVLLSNFHNYSRHDSLLTNTVLNTKENISNKPLRDSNMKINQYKDSSTSGYCILPINMDQLPPIFYLKRTQLNEPLTDCA